MVERIIKHEPKIRQMRQEDLEAVVEIDAQVFKQWRQDYYERKITVALDPKSEKITSFVMEVEGEVIGFIIGELHQRDFGLPATTVTINALGVRPSYQGRGLGSALIVKFMAHLRKIGVKSINAQVTWNHFILLKFLDKSGFYPSKRINLEMVLN